MGPAEKYSRKGFTFNWLKFFIPIAQSNVKYVNEFKTGLKMEQG